MTRHQQSYETLGLDARPGCQNWSSSSEGLVELPSISYKIATRRIWRCNSVSGRLHSRTWSTGLWISVMSVNSLVLKQHIRTPYCPFVIYRGEIPHGRIFGLRRWYFWNPSSFCHINTTRRYSFSIVNTFVHRSLSLVRGNALTGVLPHSTKQSDCLGVLD